MKRPGRFLATLSDLLSSGPQSPEAEHALPPPSPYSGAVTTQLVPGGRLRSWALAWARVASAKPAFSHKGQCVGFYCHAAGNS